jgi:hypothetical protein
MTLSSNVLKTVVVVIIHIVFKKEDTVFTEFRDCIASLWLCLVWESLCCFLLVSCISALVSGR